MNVAQGGMASHEEVPSLSLRNGFRCVPEDGVTVEDVLITLFCQNNIHIEGINIAVR